MIKRGVSPKEQRLPKVSPTTCCCEHPHACCRIHQCRVAPKGLRGLADQILLGAYTCVWQNTRTQGCSQGSKAIATATASRHTHTHLCCRKGQLRVVPKDQGLRTFGRSSSAASIHTCIAVAPRGRNFTRASPTNCCCEHTHVCCRVGHLKVAPKDQVRPTKCCCEHTHVRYKINRIRAGRHVIRLRKTRCCCNHTHVCCGQGFDRPNAAVSTHTHTCELQNKQVQGCT